MARKYEDMLDREPRARSWWDENDPSVVVNPTNPAIEQGGIAGTGGGKFAGLSPQAAWETAKNELAYTGSTPQDQGTLQRIADYLAQNGQPGFKATGADTIQTPDGQSVDVLTSGNQWWWGPEGGAQAGGGAPLSFGDFAQGPGAIPPPYASQPHGGPAYQPPPLPTPLQTPDRKSTRLNSSHTVTSY